MNVFTVGDSTTALNLPKLMRTENPMTDNDTSTCIKSSDVKASMPHPLFNSVINNIINDTLAVQIYYGETSDSQMCKKLENVLFTSFWTESGCKFYKECVSIWECHDNRICEFECRCPGNGSCELNVVKDFSDEGREWRICDMRV